MKRSLVVFLLSLVWASTSSADPMIFDVGPAFPYGPYASLYVDRSDPRRVAVGTLDGRLGWSSDSAYSVKESRIFSPRRYDAMAIRGNSTNANLGSSSVQRKTQRPVRLFIKSLHVNKGVVQWHYWRSVTDPITEVSYIQLGHPGGRMMVATPAGIVVSDDNGGAWTKTLGAPGTMPKEDKDLVGLSVIASPVNPQRVLAGTTRGVFVSSDGGMNFVPHTDPRLEAEMIFEFIWDAIDPEVVLAIGPDTILQSEDSGATFAVAYVSPGEINQVMVTEIGVLVSDTQGLTLIGAQGNQQLISGESVVGALPWVDGRALAATPEKLLLVDGTGAQEELLRTHDSDPFLRLDGAPGMAFLLSSAGVLRISEDEPRRQASRSPKMDVSLPKVQKRVLNNLGIGDPEDTRLHVRWYAKLLPRIEFNAVAVSGLDNKLNIDYTLPVDFRYARASTESSTEFSVMAMWDLSNVVFGDTNVSNPDLFIESTLTANRDMIMSEVRTRYREAAMLTHRLKTPPADPKEEFLWRSRLEEHAAYLEYVSGRQVVSQNPIGETL